MAGIDEYSTTPASNTSLNGLNITDSMAPNVLDNAFRQMMADVRTYANDVGGKAVSAGTDTITLTTETVLTAYVDGTRLTFIAGGANTGAATLNVDGVGAKAVVKGGGTALSAGDIALGMAVDVVYDASQGSGSWMLLNPTTASLTSGSFALTGDISPTQLTADQNDYAPTGIATAAVLRLTSDATRSITGISGGSDGRLLIIHNVGTAQAIQLAHEDSGSTAANRFDCPGAGTVRIMPRSTVMLQYDSTSSRWRVLSQTRSILNSVANYLSASTTRQLLDTNNVWSAAALVSLTDAATVAVDMSTFINATVTLGGNRTLGNPTNTKDGQSGIIYVVQDGTGSRTLAYSSNYKFASGSAPVLTTTAGAVDRLSYFVRSSTHIDIDISKARA